MSGTELAYGATRPFQPGDGFVEDFGDHQITMKRCVRPEIKYEKTHSCLSCCHDEVFRSCYASKNAMEITRSLCWASAWLSRSGTDSAYS
eukprot:951406-Rhodomonas_salina.3